MFEVQGEGGRLPLGYRRKRVNYVAATLEDYAEGNEYERELVSFLIVGRDKGRIKKSVKIVRKFV